MRNTPARAMIPCSVKTQGGYLRSRVLSVKVAICDLKQSRSSSVIRKQKPTGKRPWFLSFAS